MRSNTLRQIYERVMILNHESGGQKNENLVDAAVIRFRVGTQCKELEQVAVRRGVSKSRASV